MKVLVTAALLLAFAGAVSVARPSFEEAGELIHELRDEADMINTFFQDMGRHGSRGNDDTFYLVKKFILKPHQHKEFVEKWLEVRKEVQGVEGALHFTLGRIVNTNIFYANCDAWESKDLFMKYLEKDDTQLRKFMTWVNDNDIVFFWHELEPLATVAPSKTSLRHNKAGGQLGGFWVKYELLPSKIEDFKSSVKQLASKIEEQGDVQCYFAARDMDTNNIFLTYTSFDSMDKLLKHLQSEHVLKWREFIMKQDIVYEARMLKVIENVGDEEL